MVDTRERCASSVRKDCCSISAFLIAVMSIEAPRTRAGRPSREISACPVDAIHPTGEINPNECVNCLHCQVLYQSKAVCPVVIRQFAET